MSSVIIFSLAIGQQFVRIDVVGMQQTPIQTAQGMLLCGFPFLCIGRSRSRQRCDNDMVCTSSDTTTISVVNL